MPRTSGFVPTDEQWKEAERIATKRSPWPETSDALAAAAGVGFGWLIATLTIILVGMEIGDRRAYRAIMLVGAVCGLSGFLFIRSKQNAHSKVVEEVISEYERDWLRESTEHQSDKNRGFQGPHP